MLLKNRLFERQAPERDAKSIFIFCEGRKREYQYFNYFKEIDSRINIEVYELEPSENNSPKGLLEIAIKNIVDLSDRVMPKYDFHEDIDEVWLVFDTDEDRYCSREKQINKIYEECEKRKNWFAVQSNPCFEVWLYYHKETAIPNIKDIEKCSSWKKIVNTIFNGGFDSRKHPILYQDAINNSKNNFTKQNNCLKAGDTEVFLLAESINKIVSKRISEVISLI
jgi:hypothetical protein